MKKQAIKQNIFFLLFLLFFVCPITGAAKQNIPPQQVHAPKIPQQLIFADDTLSFLRYDLREQIDRELLSFTYMHSTTLLMIKRANMFFPIIEPILKKNGIPDDFKYLALIESSFNPRAVSPAKAVGIWQFMEETARKYGLEITEQVDERMNVEKATEAACYYLKESYELYQDWSIVAASYNGGRARMTRELERQKVSSFFDLFLNEETTRYVYRIIAAKELISNPSKYGLFLSKDDFYQNVRIFPVEVSTNVENWADWANECGINYGLLKYFNPWIQDIKLNNKTGKTYVVKVPDMEDIYFDVKKVNIYDEAWLE